MKPTAYLVNTSRGPIVDGPALVEALQKKAIAGAALDVFDEEPLSLDHPLQRLENTVITPHIGYVTTETYEIFFAQTVENIRAFLDGKPVRVMNASKEGLVFLPLPAGEGTRLGFYQLITALALPTVITVPSAFWHQTSKWARWRLPSDVHSLITPHADTVSPIHKMFTRLTAIFPPQYHPSPKRRVMSSDKKQMGIIPCTTTSGKPSFNASSRSVW